MDNQIETIDVDQAAVILGVTTWTVYNWVRRDLLKPITPGGKLLFDKIVVEGFKIKQPRRGRPRGKQLVAAAPEVLEQLSHPVTIPTQQKKEEIPGWMLPKSGAPIQAERDDETVEEEI